MESRCRIYYHQEQTKKNIFHQCWDRFKKKQQQSKELVESGGTAPKKAKS